MPRCPICRTPMVRVEQQNFRQFTCGSCFGVVISQLAMSRLVRRDAEQLATGSPDPALAAADLGDLVALVGESDTKKELRCPDCAKPMRREKFHAMIPVMVDVCRGCDDLFLNAGEMNLLRKLYAELMTTDDPEIVRRREKLAMANMQFENRERLSDTIGSSGEVILDASDFAALIMRLRR